MAASPNRRALLLASLAAAALAAPAAAQAGAEARPVAIHDPAVWAALIATYKALYRKERVVAARHNETEMAALEARHLPMPEKPPQATIWVEPTSLIDKGRTHVAQGYDFTFERRSDLERYCCDQPEDAAGRLAAWDAWEVHCEAAREADGVPQVERRAEVIEALWKRAYRRFDTARDELLSHPRSRSHSDEAGHRRGGQRRRADHPADRQLAPRCAWR